MNIELEEMVIWISDRRDCTIEGSVDSIVKFERLGGFAACCEWDVLKVVVCILNVFTCFSNWNVSSALASELILALYLGFSH